MSKSQETTMKIRLLQIFAVLLMGAILTAGCKSAVTIAQTITTTPNNTTVSITSQPGSIVGNPFIPGEIMATLPVYPGLSPTTELNPGFGPPSFPLKLPIYDSNAPGYQSASAQYTAAATVNDIVDWYMAELSGLGYTQQGEDDIGNDAIAYHGIAYVLPSQPAVSVQVDVYTGSGPSTSPVFELLVIYTVPLPKPAANLLKDVQNVKIDYLPNNANEIVKTFTDKQSVNNLVSMVNSLPVSPGFIRSLPAGISPQTFFTLTFHSVSQGDIVITDVTYDGIHFGDYPLLYDPYNYFEQAVENMLDIQTK
jgi:hypothetical protein